MLPTLAAVAHPAQASKLELAAPFLITILIILVSIAIYHEIVVRLELHYSRDWTERELKEIDPDRAPGTYALSSLWVIDAAQLPTILGTPLGGLFILRKVYTTEFLVFYTAVLAFGLIFSLYFLRQVRINRYPGRGPRLAGYRVSPVAIGGIALNIVCAVIAAFLVQ
jgi:hypothetical protein